MKACIAVIVLTGLLTASAGAASQFDFDFTGSAYLGNQGFELTLPQAVGPHSRQLRVRAFRVDTDGGPPHRADIVGTWTGLGVDTRGFFFPWPFDRPGAVDELHSGFTEALVLNFDQPTRIDHVELFNIDAGDVARLSVLGTGFTQDLTLPGGMSSFTEIAGNGLTLHPGDLLAIGAPIGVAALGDNGFRLSGVGATAVPVPAAAWAGVVLMGGLGGLHMLSRRGRGEA